MWLLRHPNNKCHYDNTQDGLTKSEIDRLARKNKRQLSDTQDIAVPSNKRIIFIMR